MDSAPTVFSTEASGPTHAGNVPTCEQASTFHRRSLRLTVAPFGDSYGKNGIERIGMDARRSRSVSATGWSYRSIRALRPPESATPLGAPGMAIAVADLLS